MKNKQQKGMKRAQKVLRRKQKKNKLSRLKILAKGT
jgi:hypothetical protein